MSSPHPARQLQRPSAAPSKPTRAEAWQLLCVQENERRRIARELHDEFGQLLSGLAIEVDLLIAAASHDKRLQERLQRINDLTDQMGRQMRQLAFELRPALLDDLGLIPALSNYLDVWSQRTGVAAELRSSGFRKRLPVDAETALYRIVQEGLTNVARHSRARSVDIHLQRRRHQVTLVIQDDGIGCDLREAAQSRGGRVHFGLQGMRERLALLNGTLEIESHPGKGTRLTAMIANVLDAEVPSSDTAERGGLAARKRDAGEPVAFFDGSSTGALPRVARTSCQLEAAMESAAQRQIP